MNKRVVAFALLGVFVIVLICLGLFTAALPGVNDKLAEREGETQTQNAAETQTWMTLVAKTEQAQATSDAATLAAAQTLTAIGPSPTWTVTPSLTPSPTITPTLTFTPTLTLTPTATHAAELIPCPAKIVGGTRRMFSVPGGGRLAGAADLPKGTDVEIIGRVSDRGWYQARVDGQVGWLRSDFFRISGGCLPNTYDISHLLALMSPNDQLHLEEPFFSNLYRWTFDDGELASTQPTLYGEYQLEINTNSTAFVSPIDPSLNKQLSAFRVVTSFSRSNINLESYVGIRFRDTGSRYYELRLLTGTGRNEGMCILQLFETDKMFQTQVVNPGENSCGSDDLEDYVDMSLSEGYDLEVRINDSDPYRFTLNDPNGQYTHGGISLTGSQIIAQFSYLVVTTPR